MTTAAPPPRLPYAREGQVIVSPDATPPAEDLLDLLEMEPKFRQSWGRQRPDFKEQNSHNYELSLASIALSYSWSDQAITDLLIAWRRRHQRTFQPRSAHYYQLLKAARANEEQNSIHDELPELLKSASPDRDSLLQNRLSRLLRLKIRSVARYPRPPGDLRLQQRPGLCPPGPPGGMADPGAIRGPGLSSDRAAPPRLPGAALAAAPAGLPGPGQGDRRRGPGPPPGSGHQLARRLPAGASPQSPVAAGPGRRGPPGERRLGAYPQQEPAGLAAGPGRPGNDAPRHGPPPAPPGSPAAAPNPAGRGRPRRSYAVLAAAGRPVPGSPAAGFQRPSNGGIRDGPVSGRPAAGRRRRPLGNRLPRPSNRKTRRQKPPISEASNGPTLL